MYNWIFQRINRSVENGARTIRLPVSIQPRIRLIHELLLQGMIFENVLSNGELVQRLCLLSKADYELLMDGNEEMKEELIRKARLVWISLIQQSKSIYSLDAPLNRANGEGENTTLADFIDGSMNNPETDTVGRIGLEDFIEQCQLHLTVRETNIIRYVVQGMNKSQIGETLDITRERVSQILQRDILPKILATPALKEYFEDYLTTAMNGHDQAHSEDL